MDHRPSSNRWVSKRTLSQQSKQRDKTLQCSASSLTGAAGMTNGACAGHDTPGSATNTTQPLSPAHTLRPQRGSHQIYRPDVSDAGLGNGTNGNDGTCHGSPGHDTTPHSVHTVLPADRLAAMVGHALPSKSYHTGGKTNSSSHSNSSVSANQVNYTNHLVPASDSDGTSGTVVGHESMNDGIAIGALRRSHAPSHPDGEVTPPAPRSAQKGAATAGFAGHPRDYAIPSPRHHHIQPTPLSPPREGPSGPSMHVAAGAGNGYVFNGKPHHTTINVTIGTSRGQGVVAEPTDGASGPHSVVRHVDPSPSVRFTGTGYEGNDHGSRTDAGPARAVAAPLTTAELLAMLKTGRDAATPTETAESAPQPTLRISGAAPAVSLPAPPTTTAVPNALAPNASLGLTNGTFGGNTGIRVVSNGMIVNSVSLQQLIAAGALPATSTLTPSGNTTVNGGVTSGASSPTAFLTTLPGSPATTRMPTAQQPQASPLPPPPQYGSLSSSNDGAAAATAAMAASMPTVVLGPMSVFNSVPDITAALSAGLLGQHEVQFIQADQTALIDGRGTVGCSPLPQVAPHITRPLNVTTVANKAAPSAAALAASSSAFTYDSLNSLLSNMLSPSVNVGPRGEAKAELPKTCESQDAADSPMNLMQCVLPILEDDDEDIDGPAMKKGSSFVSDRTGYPRHGDTRERQTLLGDGPPSADRDADVTRETAPGGRPAPWESANLAFDVTALGLPPLPVDGQVDEVAHVMPDPARPGFSAVLLSQRMTNEERQGRTEGVRLNGGVTEHNVGSDVQGRRSGREMYFAPGPHTVTRTGPAPIAAHATKPTPDLVARVQTQPVTDLRGLLSELTEPTPGVAAADGVDAASTEPQAAAAPLHPTVGKPHDAQLENGDKDGIQNTDLATQQPAPAPRQPTMAELLAGGARGGVTQAGASPLFANAWRQAGQEKGVAWPIETASPLLRKLNTQVVTPTPAAAVVGAQSVLLATTAAGVGKTGGRAGAAAAAASASFSATTAAKLTPVVSAMTASARKEAQPRCVVTASESAATAKSKVEDSRGRSAAGGATAARDSRTSSNPALDAPTVTRESLVAVFRDTPQSLRRRERACRRHDETSALCKSAAWPPHTEVQVERLLKQRNATKLLRHLTIVSFSRQHVHEVQELFDGWARNGIPAPDMSFGAYYYYVQEKSEKLLCMKHNGRGSALVRGAGKCDFESRRPNTVCRYEHVCLFCRSKEHGWFEESKCEGYQQLLNEMEELGVTEEDVEIMLDAMENSDKASA